MSRFAGILHIPDQRDASWDSPNCRAFSGATTSTITPSNRPAAMGGGAAVAPAISPKTVRSHACVTRCRVSSASTITRSSPIATAATNMCARSAGIRCCSTRNTIHMPRRRRSRRRCATCAGCSVTGSVTSRRVTSLMNMRAFAAIRFSKASPRTRLSQARSGIPRSACFRATTSTF
jgi:hypothetical protein